VDPAVSGPDSADRIAVAHTGEEAIALVPLPAIVTALPESESAEGDAAGADGEDADALAGEPGLHADALLASVREPLTAGLADDGRLTLGVSAAVHSAEGLRG
ncbi:PucR family transcriptional regulator, partial [Streptomyces sp. SID7982]|nr:PucR family transcriptional regulator [Streptomyces sp. SID7982]